MSWCCQTSFCNVGPQAADRLRGLVEQVRQLPWRGWRQGGVVRTVQGRPTGVGIVLLVIV